MSATTRDNSDSTQTIFLSGPAGLARILAQDQPEAALWGPEEMRAMWQHQQEITEGLYFQGQLGLLSDKNFLEQYYKNEFDMGPNQETFAYLTWQRRNFGASALIEDRFNRQWVSETNWLPRAAVALELELWTFF